MKKSGFTLAEILITLTVIGVVASMTIPTLMNNTQDQQNKTAWKKAFAEITQATNRIITDNGGSLKGLCASSDHDCLVNKFLPYLSYIKYCDASTAFGNCFANSLKYLNGTSASAAFPTRPSVILNNGTLVRFSFNSSSCSDPSGTIFRCGYITIDVNGLKEPNTLGKDIFWGALLEKSYKPAGFQDSAHDPNVTCIEGSTATNNTGDGCSAKYLYQ